MSAWSILQKRDNLRTKHRAIPSTPPTSADEFYSASISRDNDASNFAGLAYDRTAVTGPSGTYLNASVVRDGRGGWWVAAEAPRRATIPVFLEAIQQGWASRHPLVARTDAELCDVSAAQDDATQETQPASYKDSEQDATTRRAIIVQLTTDEDVINQNVDEYLDPKVPKTFDKELNSWVSEGRIGERPYTHYHYKAWPDGSVTEESDRDALRSLVRLVDRRRVNEQCEVWVHCVAGMGRTGTFIALSSLLAREPSTNSLVQQEASPLGALPAELENDKVAQTVDTIREYRMGSVERQRQYDLISEMV